VLEQLNQDGDRSLEPNERLVVQLLSRYQKTVEPFHEDGTAIHVELRFSPIQLYTESMFVHTKAYLYLVSVLCSLAFATLRLKLLPYLHQEAELV